MKRFLVLLGVLCLTVGIKLNFDLSNCGYMGKLSEGKFDSCIGNASVQRYDVVGDMDTAENMIQNLGAKELFRERVDDIDVIYAYSPLLCSPVVVHGHKVNLMIAVSERGVTLGMPLIYGSY